MEDIYGNIEEYNPNKERKALIVVHDMIADMLSNKKLNPILTESFIRNRELYIYTYLFLLQNLILVHQKILD